MKTVSIKIRGAVEAPRELEFLRWKDDGRAFDAKGQGGEPVVVMLTPAWPEQMSDTHEGDLRYQMLPDGWQEVAYGPEWKLPPVRIVPCCLVRPPFRASKDEWDAIIASLPPPSREAMWTSIPLPSGDQRVTGYTPLEPWEVRFLQTGRRPLYLTPDDDEPLRARLNAVMQDGGRSQKVLDAAMKDQQEVYNGEKEEAKRIKDPEERKRMLASVEEDYRFLGDPLELVKRGELGILDRYLLEPWAKTEGVNWVEMERWRRELYRKFKSDFLSDEEPLFKTLCARVTYRIEWEDDAAYLFNCKIPEGRLQRCGYGMKAESSAEEGAGFAGVVLPVKWPRFVDTWQMMTAFKLGPSQWRKAVRAESFKKNSEGKWNLDDALDKGWKLEIDSDKVAELYFATSTTALKKIDLEYWECRIKRLE